MKDKKFPKFVWNKKKSLQDVENKKIQDLENKKKRKNLEPVPDKELYGADIELADGKKIKNPHISFINELVGHHHGNIDLDRYGKGFTTDIIYNKCVKKINYETSHTRGIDFKSLKLDWKKLITTRVW